MTERRLTERREEPRRSTERRQGATKPTKPQRGPKIRRVRKTRRYYDRRKP